MVTLIDVDVLAECCKFSFRKDITNDNDNNNEPK